MEINDPLLFFCQQLSPTPYAKVQDHPTMQLGSSSSCIVMKHLFIWIEIHPIRVMWCFVTIWIIWPKRNWPDSLWIVGPWGWSFRSRLRLPLGCWDHVVELADGTWMLMRKLQHSRLQWIWMQIEVSTSNLIPSNSFAKWSMTLNKVL